MTHTLVQHGTLLLSSAVVTEEFQPKMTGGAAAMDDKTKRLTSLMHKAIAVIQFKIEGQMCIRDRHRTDQDSYEKELRSREHLLVYYR